MDRLVDNWGHLTPTGKRVLRHLGTRVATLVKPLVGKYPRCELEAMLSEVMTHEIVSQYSCTRSNPRNRAAEAASCRDSPAPKRRRSLA